MLGANICLKSVKPQKVAKSRFVDFTRCFNSRILLETAYLYQGHRYSLSTKHKLISLRQKLIIPPTPLTDEEVDKTFFDIEEAIRFRLRLSEIIPVEMSDYRIGEEKIIRFKFLNLFSISESGRVHFTVKNLFQTSLCLWGSTSADSWFMVDVEFLINIGGDLTGLQG